MLSTQYCSFIFSEDQKDSPAELAFKYAIYKINRDQEVR